MPPLGLTARGRERHERERHELRIEEWRAPEGIPTGTAAHAAPSEGRRENPEHPPLTVSTPEYAGGAEGGGRGWYHAARIRLRRSWNVSCTRYSPAQPPARAALPSARRRVLPRTHSTAYGTPEY